MDFGKMGDLRKIGPAALLGFGAAAAGVIALALGRRAPKPAKDEGVGAAPGDSTTSPVAPRPATVAAAPVGMAETEKGFRERPGASASEHVPTDLLSDTPVSLHTRAPEAFRPDPTAVPTAEEREALRPATGPAPTLVADRGSGFSEAAGAA